MSNYFQGFLTSQSWMRVVLVLHQTARPCSLREIVDLSGLSPGGVQDLLRRLEEAEVVLAKPHKNKKLFSLCLSEEEQDIYPKALRRLI